MKQPRRLVRIEFIREFDLGAAKPHHVGEVIEVADFIANALIKGGRAKEWAPGPERDWEDVRGLVQVPLFSDEIK
jgi:hypothetical protein